MRSFLRTTQHRSGTETARGGPDLLRRCYVVVTLLQLSGDKPSILGKGRRNPSRKAGACPSPTRHQNTSCPRRHICNGCGKVGTDCTRGRACPGPMERPRMGRLVPSSALQRAPNHVVVHRRSRATPRPIFHSKRFCAPGEVAASATTPSCFARPTRIPAIRVVRPSASRSTRHCTTDATKRRTLGALACSEASSATTSAPNTLSSRSHPLDLPDGVVFV
jgi:hypothetical protein